jgi:hypothetical protein
MIAFAGADFVAVIAWCLDAPALRYRDLTAVACCRDNSAGGTANASWAVLMERVLAQEKPNVASRLCQGQTSQREEQKETAFGEISLNMSRMKGYRPTSHHLARMLYELDLIERSLQTVPGPVP